MNQPQASFRIGWRSQDLLSAVFQSVLKILVCLLLLTIGWLAASAAIVIVALGVSTALNQAGITAAVREPVLYTVLLTCGAILAIGVGGGLVKPMQARWERMLAAAERESGGQFAAQGHGQPAVGQPGRRQPDDQPPGPRYLQNFSFSPGHGYLHDPGFSPGPGYRQSFGPPSAGLGAEPGFQDDPVNYPGGQYM
jgi:hypothetical protein